MASWPHPSSPKAQRLPARWGDSRQNTPHLPQVHTQALEQVSPTCPALGPKHGDPKPSPTWPAVPQCFSLSSAPGCSHWPDPAASVLLGTGAVTGDGHTARSPQGTRTRPAITAPSTFCQGWRGTSEVTGHPDPQEQPNDTVAPCGRVRAQWGWSFSLVSGTPAPMALSSSSSSAGTGSREGQTHGCSPLGIGPGPGALCRWTVGMAGGVGGETGQQGGAFWDRPHPGGQAKVRDSSRGPGRASKGG